MGCDIHSFIEIRKDGKWRRLVEGGVTAEEWEREYHKREKSLEPFSWRSYGMFAFLAGVRNYSAVPVLVEPRGLPKDVSAGVAMAWEEEGYYCHTASFLSVADLLAHDYDSTVEDRRYSKRVGTNSWDGGATAEPGQGTMTTWREFLGPTFMQQLDDLKAMGKPDDVRVVFWFDN